jgi:hypothetical protein
VIVLRRGVQFSVFIRHSFPPWHLPRRTQSFSSGPRIHQAFSDYYTQELSAFIFRSAKMVKDAAFSRPGESILDEKAHESERIEELNSNREELGIDPVLDKRLTRKFDRHIMPWLFGLFLFAFIDRSNIGNARIDGLATDLHLDANKFNVALAVFYVPYICIDVCRRLKSC